MSGCPSQSLHLYNWEEEGATGRSIIVSEWTFAVVLHGRVRWWRRRYHTAKSCGRLCLHAGNKESQQDGKVQFHHHRFTHEGQTNSLCVYPLSQHFSHNNLTNLTVKTGHRINHHKTKHFHKKEQNALTPLKQRRKHSVYHKKPENHRKHGKSPR